MTEFDENKLEGIAKYRQCKPHIHYDVEAGRWYASYKGWCVHGETPKDAFDKVLETLLIKMRKMTEMKSNMTLNVDFLIGTDIKDAVREAKEKAVIFNVVYVCFTFNDKTFSIGRNANVEEVVDEYYDALGVANRKHICYS